MLCGSEAYPVKDPFVELLKSSMATFLNAMTYPDRTVYPVASQNHEDYRNLASVYMDAVFKPLIREEHFMQEGHRLGFSETGNIDSELITKGIVYNEMKGAYSDLDGVMYRATSNSISPDNAYGYDSGGDPQYIPDLTYEEFCDFHKTLYHPSNGYAVTYGDISFTDNAEFMAQRLEGFTAQETDTDIAAPVRWDAPRNAEVPYPIGVDEETTDKSALSCTWLTNDATDTQTWLALKLLEVYLLENDAAPLRKAIVTSGLGGDLGMAGYMDYLRDTWFTVSLKNSSGEKFEAFKQVITACLEEQVQHIDADLLQAAFHQFELSVGDIPGQFPLRLMGRAYQRWIYGADPIDALDLTPHLAELRSHVEQNPQFLGDIIQRWLLDNPHRLDQVFVPDSQANARAENAEKRAFSRRTCAIKSRRIAAHRRARRCHGSGSG